LTGRVVVLPENFTCPGIRMYTCQNNRCIYERWFCDGEDDCRTGEDEDPARCNSMQQFWFIVLQPVVVQCTISVVVFNKQQ